MFRGFPSIIPTASLLALAAGLSFGPAAAASLRLPACFGDHLVLQRGQPDPVWGWDAPGTVVRVTFAGQTKSATADAAGSWRVALDPMPASHQPATLTVQGSATVELRDVLVGEVWLCSGQSNMALPLDQVRNGDLEALTMRQREIRWITVPATCTQEPQENFSGTWKVCSPAEALSFSALAQLYARYLHQALDVPIGLIDNSAGGASIATWMDRRELERDPQFAGVMADCRRMEAHATERRSLAKYEADLAAYDEELEAWRAEKLRNPASELRKPHRPPDPRDFMDGKLRAGNLYNGSLRPLIGYGIRGVIWYQGEADVRDAGNYRKLFPALIQEWRRAWGQGDFPFYWVQLPGYGPEPEEPGDAIWAELREAQTAALALPHTGQCVTIDIGEAHDLHPRNKLDVAARLVRWPLARDYGIAIPCCSPGFKEMTVKDGKAIVTLDAPGSGLQSDPSTPLSGFAICGADRKWVRAEARVIAPDTVEVGNPEVASPVAVRYGWADHPCCNLVTRDGLPVTPFRTDHFEFPPPPKVIKSSPGAAVEKK